MYTIIKGDDVLGGGKHLSTGVSHTLQTGPSCSAVYDAREVLIDYTQKENSPIIISSDHLDNINKIKNQSYVRSEVQKLVKSKEPKLQCASEISALNLSEPKLDSNYSPRIYEPAKDDSNSNDFRQDSSLQFDFCERGNGLVFEDNQMKEILTNLMIRKDMDTERNLLKEFENSSQFSHEVGQVLLGGKLISNIQHSSDTEKNITHRNDNDLLLSRQATPFHTQKINSLSSLIVEPGPNLLKRTSLSFKKQDDRVSEKLETTSNDNSYEPPRLCNKSLFSDQDSGESKLISSLPFSLGDIRLRNVPHYFHEALEDMPSSTLSGDRERLIDHPSNLQPLNLRFLNVKNSEPLCISSEEIKFNESSLSLIPTEENVTRNMQSPYCETYDESHLNNSVSDETHRQQLKYKNSSSSNPDSMEQISLKNSFIISLGQDLTKNDAGTDIDFRNQDFSVINLSQLKSLASSSMLQESVHNKSIETPANNDEIYQQKPTSVNVYPQEDQENVSKRLNIPCSLSQLEFILKNDPSILEKALSGFHDVGSNDKRGHTSKIINLTNILGKEAQASCSTNVIQESIAKNIVSIPLVTQLKPIDNTTSPDIHLEDKIRHFSFPIYDDNQKQSVYDLKQERAHSFHPAEQEAVDYRLKNESLPYNSTLSNHESINLQSALRITQDEVNFLKQSQESRLQTASIQIRESFQNQCSVIAQVGMSCKVCTFCRTFFSENGFLIEDESCSLCLHHAKSGMKCVCQHPDMKEQTCSCGSSKYGCSKCEKTFSSLHLLEKHKADHSPDSSLISAEKNENICLYDCPICNSSFLSNTSLEHHMSLHKDYHCSNCNRTFVQFNATKHFCKARYVCSLCGAGLASNFNLKMHLLKHSGSLPYKCRDCNKSFARPSELRNHSVVHSGERPFSCDECSMSFTCIINLRSHKTTHTGRKPHTCQICHKNFSRPADVKRHMVIHSGARPYACEVCGLAFADASNMKKHLMTHSKPNQSSEIKTYHCTFCGKMFSRPSELKRHFFTHTNTRPYACHICGLAFADASNLKKHIQTHERGNEHSCLQCDSIFKSFPDLEMHMSLSHGRKRFDSNHGLTCQTCGATFTQPVDMQDHVLSHGPSPTFRCDVCSKNFCEQVFLVKHSLTHTESRPFICHECSRSFKSLSHLRSHILIHTGEKTHVCSKCNRSFLKKSSFIRHQRVHSREKVQSIYQFA